MGPSKIATPTPAPLRIPHPGEAWELSCIKGPLEFPCYLSTFWGLELPLGCVPLCWEFKLSACNNRNSEICEKCSKRSLFGLFKALDAQREVNWGVSGFFWESTLGGGFFFSIFFSPLVNFCFKSCDHADIHHVDPCECHHVRKAEIFMWFLNIHTHKLANLLFLFVT